MTSSHPGIDQPDFTGGGVEGGVDRLARGRNARDHMKRVEVMDHHRLSTFRQARKRPRETVETLPLDDRVFDQENILRNMLHGSRICRLNLREGSLAAQMVESEIAGGLVQEGLDCWTGAWPMAFFARI